jgi:hypothetical protein
VEIEGDEGRGMQNAKQKQIDRKVCFGLTRKKWSYIDHTGKRKTYWSDGPTRGRGRGSSQGNTFAPKKEVGNSLLE